MSRISLASFVSPVAGLAVFLLIGSGERIASSYFVWFAIAGLLQLGGGALFLVKEPRRWTLGVICFWLSAAAFMGGYSDLHLQDKTLTGGDKETVQYLQYVMSLLFVAVFGTLGAVSSREVQESHGLEVEEETKGTPVHD